MKPMQNSTSPILRSMFYIPSKLIRWCTKTRLRKILSSILALLMLLTSIKYVFVIPKNVKAADVYMGLNEGFGTTSAVNDSNATLSAGTITNATWKSEDLCKTGKCLYFDGSGDYVSFADNANLDMGSGETVTIEGWFRTPDITSGTRTIIAKDETTGADGGYRIEILSSGFVRFGIDNDNTFFPSDSVTSTNAYDDNSWHHFAAVKNGATSITLYIDAISVGTPDSSIQNDVSNNDSFYIGRFESDTAQDFKGFIDEIKVLRTARTATEINSDFTGGTLSRGTSALFGPDQSYLSSGLVGYWKMDEAAANSCTGGSNDTCDKSGNSNDLLWDTNTSTTTGKFGNGVNYDGSNTSLVYATNTLTGLNPVKRWSIGVWFKTSDTQGYIFDTRDGTSNNYGFGLYTDGANTLKFFLVNFNNTITYKDYTYSATVTDNNWHYATVTRDGDNSVKLYIDGSYLPPSVTTLDTDISAFSNTWLDVYFGHRYSLNIYNYTGIMDEARIYSRGLTSAEVQKLYTWTPGPLAEWKLDENSGSTANDSTGNGYTGTLTDSPTWQTGKFGSALKFYDTGDATTEPAVTIADDTFDSLSQGSVSMWIKPDNSGDSWQDVFGMGENTSRWWELAFDKANSAIAFSSGGAGSNCTMDLSTPLTNPTSWHHFVFTDSASGNNLYIDGVKVTPTYTNGTSSTDCFFADWTGGGTSYYRIGCWSATGDCLPGEMYQGLIDNVKLYDYPISNKQIIEEMNGGHPAPGSPVGSALGVWKFDEGADNTCSGGTNDACNSGSAGTVLDGAESNMAVPATSTSGWTNVGKYNKGLNFDASNDTVNFGSNTAIDDLPATGMTISSWIYPTSMGESSQGVIMAKNSGATPSSGWLLQFAGTNALKFSVDGSTDLVRQTSNNAVTLNAWNNVVLAWDGVITTASSVHIYINGLETSYATTTDGASRVSDAASSLFAGNDSSGASTFAGTIDELKLFNTALSSDQALLLNNEGSAAVLGAISTDTSGNASWSAQRGFCPPGNADTNCASGDPSPIFYTPFDENTGTSPKDISVNGLTPSLSGSLSWMPGKFGQSVFFDGGSNRIDYSNATIFDFGTSTAFTIQGWFKLQSNAADQELVGRMGVDAGKAGFLLTMIAAGNKLNANIRNPSPVANCRVDTSTSTNFIDGNWHFITVIFNRNASCTTSDIIYYIDGRIDNNTTVGVASGNANQDIGVTGLQVGSTNGFKGQGDEIRVYNYAKTPAQIAWDYNNGKPTGWWKFDENTGTTSSDSSGNGYNTSAFTGNATWATGKYNTGITFDGTDDAVQITEGSKIDVGATNESYSVAAWFKTSTNFSANAAIVAKDDGTGAYPYSLYLNSSEQACFQISDGTNAPSTCGSTALNDGLWHFVTGKRDIIADNVYIYVDGLLVNSTTDTTTATAANNDNVSVGNSGTSYTANDFNGQIDEVRIYNYPVTVQQLDLILNNSSAVRYGS